MKKKTRYRIHLVLLVSSLIMIASNQFSGIPGLALFSPYPGENKLGNYVVANKSGRDGKGLHWSGSNIPGLDTYGPGGKFYLPVEVCWNKGDSVYSYTDDVGAGGYGLIIYKYPGDGSEIKMMFWHFEGFDKTFQNLIAKRSGCVPAKTFVGWEGGSLTTPSGITTLVAGGFVEHSHDSIGRNKPWPNTLSCSEPSYSGGFCQVNMSGYWWINMRAIAATWNGETPITSDTNSERAEETANNDAVKAANLVIPTMKFSEVPIPKLPVNTIMLEDGRMGLHIENPAEHWYTEYVNMFTRRQWILITSTILLLLVSCIAIKPKKKTKKLRIRPR